MQSPWLITGTSLAATWWGGYSGRERGVPLDASHLQELIGEWKERLLRISEQDSLKVVGSKWTRRQLLGHLIDSASNNYQRFVRLQQGHLVGFPGYDQEFWVAAGNYSQCPWHNLVDFWYLYNLQIVAVIEHIPSGCEEHVWEGHDVNLDFLVTDYTRHMLHHLTRMS